MMRYKKLDIYNMDIMGAFMVVNPIKVFSYGFPNCTPVGKASD